MTKLRIFLLVFGSLFVNLLILLGLPSIGNGCAVPPDYFEGYVTFFNSNLAHDSLFAKYYYDMANNRSDYQIDEAVGESQTTANLREWKQYFGPEIAADQIADLVYKRPPAELEKVQKEVLKGGGAVGAATGNKALDWIARPERLPALDYLIYAKQCEPYVIVTSPWDVEQEIKERRKPAEMLKLMEVGLGKYQLAQTSFLRLRYGYQIVRLAHYAGKPQDCLKYYQQLVAPLGSQSIIAAWAARLQNGALLKIGRQAQALVATSLMFDQNPLMMDEAYTDFTIPPDPVWEECLRLAGIPHRQATLWMLRGLQEKRIMLLPVQKMYALEPGSSRLEVMLIRHVNQIERLHFSSALFLGDDRPVMTANQRFALKYIRELAAFIKTVDLQKVHQPALWGAVAGYLSMAEKRHEQAAQYLTTAAAEAVVSKTRIWRGKSNCCNV